MYRLRYAERKVYIVFDAHPISGVLFVCLKHLFGRTYSFNTPVGVLFCFARNDFRGKPSNMSQTENSVKPKGDFLR